MCLSGVALVPVHFGAGFLPEISCTFVSGNWCRLSKPSCLCQQAIEDGFADGLWKVLG